MKTSDDLHSETLRLHASVSLLENLVCYVITYTNTVELGHNDFNLCDTSFIALRIRRYQLNSP